MTTLSALPAHAVVVACSGCTPFIARAILVGALQIGTYDHFRAFFTSAGIASPFLVVTAASASAGALYSAATMPLETLKNALAFQRRDALTGSLQYASMSHAARSIVTTRGVAALWNGFTPYYVRCSVFSVAMFSAVEWLRSLLQ